MTLFQEYLEKASQNQYAVATENGINIDLGKHAQERSHERLLLSKEKLIEIGKKIANVFNKSNPDGLFGFYSQSEHVSGIFRYNKAEKIIKFITIFPNKRVHFFNNIEGAIVFNESSNGKIIEGIPYDESIQDIIYI